MMCSKKQTKPTEVKPQSEKKVWVAPALEIIGTDDIEAGSTPGGAEHAKTLGGTGFYHS